MSDPEALLERALAGDEEAKREVAKACTLRAARVILGGTPEARGELVRDLAHGDERVPGLGVLLAAIARDGDAAVRRAADLVVRARRERWDEAERAAVGAWTERHGSRLGAEAALELLEWATRDGARAPAGFVAGAEAALADARDGDFEQLGWRGGFSRFVVLAGGSPVLERWTAAPLRARAIAKALFQAHARGDSAVVSLDALWTRTPARSIWAAAVAEAANGNRGMSGRDTIADWSWERFCAHPGERADLYAAFAGWLEMWNARRDALPASRRPAGESAVAHLALWGGLDVTRLMEVVEEAVRIMRADELAPMVDAAFDLADAAPREVRLQALAGACKLSFEVRNRARGDVDGVDAAAPATEAASDRLLARAERTAGALRASGAMLEPYVGNRIEDLEDSMRMIREARARRAERGAEAARREQAQQARAAAEQQRADAQRQAEETRRLAEIELQARIAAIPQPPAPPPLPPDPIDTEIFFASLPAAPTLAAYARIFRRLSREPNAVTALAAEGISMEMIAVVNQTWAALFAKRPELALRFSRLIT